jgi:hypothetical protein
MTIDRRQGRFLQHAVGGFRPSDPPIAAKPLRSM